MTLPDLFSADGIDAWRARLDASPHFAHAAAGWTGTLVLVEKADGRASRRTWIEVNDGRCVDARPASDADSARAEFVLAAGPDVWQDLVGARVSPAMAAMTGRLKLLQGDLMRLVPHAKAAAALLAAAAHGEPI